MTAREVACSHEEYHAEMEHDSSSSIRLADSKPLKYYAQRIAKTMPRDEDTKSKMAGSVAHIAVLEPERLDASVAVIPRVVLSQNGAKAGKAWEEWRDAHKGKYLLKADEYDDYMRRSRAVAENDWAADLLGSATSFEQSIFWTDPTDGWKLKVRLDVVCALDDVIADLKFTKHPANEFWRSCEEYRLEWQAALQCEGYRQLNGQPPCQYIYILVHNEEPYHCIVKSVPKEYLRKGRSEIANAIRTLYRRKAGELSWYPEGHGVRSEMYFPPFYFNPR